MPRIASDVKKHASAVKKHASAHSAVKKHASAVKKHVSAVKEHASAVKKHASAVKKHASAVDRTWRVPTSQPNNYDADNDEYKDDFLSALTRYVPLHWRFDKFDTSSGCAQLK